MRYNKIFFAIILTSFAFMQETPTDPAPAADPNAVEGKVESLKNLLLNPCEGLNEEDCTKTEGCEYNAEEKVCSQSEVSPVVEETALTEEPAPIDFKEEYVVKLNLGGILPIGKNLSGKISAGPNINVEIVTPFGLNLENSKILAAGNIDIISLSATNGSPYSIMSLGGKAVIQIKSLNLFGGLGLSNSSYTLIECGGVSAPDDCSDKSSTTAFFTAGVSYKLPISKFLKSNEANTSSFDPSLISASIFGKAIEVLGAPTENGGTSDLISFGLSVGYPISF